MHIPDAFITPTTAALMFGISLVCLAYSWKKVQAEYPKSFAPLLAISSAFVFAAQMINFPIIFGTSGHLVGGTFLAVLLGPWAGMLSMTIVLLMQAVFFADGGIIAFGANVFNMAIIGAKFLLSKTVQSKFHESEEIWFKRFPSIMAFCGYWLVAGRIADRRFACFCGSWRPLGNCSSYVVLARLDWFG